MRNLAPQTKQKQENDGTPTYGDLGASLENPDALNVLFVPVKACVQGAMRRDGDDSAPLHCGCGRMSRKLDFGDVCRTSCEMQDVAFAIFSEGATHVFDTV